MSLTFPRDMTGALRWRDPRLFLQRNEQISPVAGGATQAKLLGPSLWRAEFTSVPYRLAMADAVEADFATLQGAVRTFFLAPPTRLRPASDAAGASALNGVTIAAIRADRGGVRLAGLPALFEMTAGDYLSITTQAGGTEFHQLARGAIADGAGLSPLLEITPPARFRVNIGDAVGLTPPRLEMRLERDGFSAKSEGLSHRIFTLKAVQVVR